MAHQPQYVGPEYIQNPLRPIAAGKLGTPEVVTVAGALSVDVSDTDIQLSQGVDQALTLANGDPFQTKTIALTVKGGAGNAVLTPANLAGGTTITFNSVGDHVMLKFLAGEWYVTANVGCVVA